MTVSDWNVLLLASEESGRSQYNSGPFLASLVTVLYWASPVIVSASFSSAAKEAC